MDNLINIGTIVGTQHLLGKVKAQCMLSEISLLENEKVLIEKNEDKRILTVKNIKRLNDKKIVILFNEIDTLEKAKAINGYKIKIRRDILPEVDENNFYINDILGFEIYENDEMIGSIVNTIETSAHNILVIENDEKEIMIPLVDNFVKEIDFNNKKIYVELIEGMR